MKNIFTKMIMALAVGGLISLTLVQIANAAVPFKGRGTGEIVAVQPLPTGVLITANARGNATHLGTYTRVENILLGAGGNFTGDVTFTAANGDQLTANIAGAFTSPATASGTYSFTGGTGRFADATGTAHFSVALTDLVHFTVEFNGSIDK